MGELCTIELSSRPFHTGIGCTFAEIDMVFAWETFEIIIGEDQLAIDQTIDHQAIVFFAQFNGTRVVTLKRAALRCDRAV